MNRAYAILTAKAVEEGGKRIVRGVATTPAVDRVGDVIDPAGVKFGASMPFLWQHRHDQPIGWVTFGAPTKTGIPFEAEVATVDEDGELKAFIDKCWQQLRIGLVRAVSIGFRAIKWAWIGDYDGIEYQEIEVYELSAVTIPANQEALITEVSGAKGASVLEGARGPELIRVIKSFDEGAPAASGRPTPPAKPTPGASGKSVAVKVAAASPKAPKEGHHVKTIAEQIAAFRETRTTKSARMNEIMGAAAERGETLDQAEAEEYDGLEAEVKAIDVHIKRLESLEASKASAAKPVPVTDLSGAAASEARAVGGVQVKAQQKAAPGIEFARLAKVKALAFLSQGEHRQTDIAKSLYGEESVVYRLVSKAAVVAGSSQANNWAADLVGDETAVYADFAAYLRPMTIVGKFGSGNVPSLRNVPFRTPLLGQTGGGAAYWVGEGKPKPLTAMDFSRTTLDELKVATIAVVTEELLRKSSPSADGILRDTLAAAVAERVDIDFIDPAKAASANVSPASITNGVTPITSTGNDADAVREDLRALWGTFIAANNTPTTAVYVMSAMTALGLSLMRNPLGQAEFPGLTMNGGVLDGVPVITSEYFAPVTAGGYVALINAQDIYFGDEGGVQVDVSREASLQMLDNPTNDTVTPTATTMVSMWQTNSVAFRAERILNWAKRRASAVALLEAVNWGQPTG